MDDKLIMFYAGKEHDMARIAISMINKEDFTNKTWTWSRHRLLLPILFGVHNRNAVLFPEKIDGRLLCFIDLCG